MLVSTQRCILHVRVGAQRVPTSLCCVALNCVLCGAQGQSDLHIKRSRRHNKVLVATGSFNLRNGELP